MTTFLSRHLVDHRLFRIINAFEWNAERHRKRGVRNPKLYDCYSDEKLARNLCFDKLARVRELNEINERTVGSLVGFFLAISYAKRKKFTPGHVSRFILPPAPLRQFESFMPPR